MCNLNYRVQGLLLNDIQIQILQFCTFYIVLYIGQHAQLFTLFAFASSVTISHVFFLHFQ